MTCAIENAAPLKLVFDTQRELFRQSEYNHSTAALLKSPQNISIYTHPFLFSSLLARFSEEKGGKQSAHLFFQEQADDKRSWSLITV